MPGFNPDKLNIHDLTVEQPERYRMPFDLEQVITDKERTAFQAGFGVTLKYNDYEDTAFVAARLTAIGEKPELSSEQWNQIKESLIFTCERNKILPKHVDVGYVSEAMADMAMSGQGILDLDFDSHWITASFNRFKIVNPLEAFKQAANLKIINRDFYLDESYMTTLSKKVDKWRASKDHFTSMDLIQALAYAKIADLGIEANESDWEKAKKLLRACKENPNGDLLNLYFCLNILSADEIHIPENGGLKLIHRDKENFKTATPQLPEQRNF